MDASTVVKTTEANRRVTERNTDRSIISLFLLRGLVSVLDGRVFLIFVVLSLLAFIWFVVVVVVGWFATFVGRLRRVFGARVAHEQLHHHRYHRHHRHRHDGMI